MESSDMDNSDDEEVDHENYKGAFYNIEEENKCVDPIYGAHFLFDDMVRRLNFIKVQRDRDIAKELRTQGNKPQSKCENNPSIITQMYMLM